MNNEQIRFIDRLYKDLYLDESVIHHGSGNKYDKLNNIKMYLQKLEHIHNKVANTGRHIEFLRKLYHDKYVIKPEDIPESYYERQKQIALERGYGHIEMTETEKKSYQEKIINDQKSSLDVWLNYLMSDDAKVYPFWAKYWAFQGMLKLGLYNKETGNFGKRTKDTIAPFPDLNREALALSIDLVVKMFNKEPIGDKELEKLVKSGSFGKIYSYVMFNVLKDKKSTIKKSTGKWVKYNQGSNHMTLVKSLQGYNTGWCIAGEATAESYLSDGDFYIYYTLDENGEYKVPRIAIRMENGKIAEIRGVAEEQNLESEMEMILEEKLKEFPDKEDYYEKVSDMKILTYIYKKHKNKEELTKEEILFLYEIDDKIKGFGYGKDPRILEIKQERNKIQDLSICFKGKTNYPKTIDLRELTSAKGLDLPENVEGSLELNNLKNIEGLTLPKSIGGNLRLDSLTSAEGLILPKSVGGGLNLDSLTSAKGLTLPEYIGKYLSLDGLQSAKGLVLPEYLIGSLLLNKLTNIEGLVLPKNIGHALSLNSITSAKGLVFPETIGTTLCLESLTNSEGLTLPQSIGGNLMLNSLEIAEGIVFPENIGGYLDLESLTTIKNLKLPKKVGGSLYLSNLTNAEGVEFPEEIGVSLQLKKLTTIKDIVLPKKVGGYLELSSITSAEGLILPKSVGSDLYLNGLTSAEGLVFPKTIGDSLYLNNLTKKEGLELPKSIGKNLDLRSLENAKGLIFPENIGGYLELSSITSTEGLILPKSVGSDLYLDGLTSANGLVLPNVIERNLILRGLRSAEGLVLPAEIYGYVDLQNLTSLDGITLPPILTYEIKMKGFTITPDNVDEYINNPSKKSIL